MLTNNRRPKLLQAIEVRGGEAAPPMLAAGVATVSPPHTQEMSAPYSEAFAKQVAQESSAAAAAAAGGGGATPSVMGGAAGGGAAAGGAGALMRRRNSMGRDKEAMMKMMAAKGAAGEDDDDEGGGGGGGAAGGGAAGSQQAGSLALSLLDEARMSLEQKIEVRGAAAVASDVPARILPPHRPPGRQGVPCRHARRQL